MLALPLLALCAACAAPTASASGPSPHSEQSYWPGQQALTDAAGAVDAIGVRWPDVYAGVSLDLPADVLLVHRVPAAGFDEAVRRLVPHVTVRFVDAEHAALALDRQAERVVRDVDYWRQRGVSVHSVGTTIGECVTVGVGDPDRDAAVVTAHYRGVPLCVEQGAPLVPLPAN
ncbi:hypothetical protein D7223_05760 [Micromonospora endolithica]|uniref:Uncharacterized protein n=1 Tax=Micromonospora endolithica TaxID=230091 RepID=A0A3A9ZV19_9ACTN|nr:hypothetical protein D7223_05760 [Micromonospora endolithica]